MESDAGGLGPGAAPSPGPTPTPAPLTYPEGAQIDEALRASFEALHAGKVSHQEFINSFFARGQELTAAAAQKAEAEKAAQIQKWSDEIMMDPAFGGPKLAQTINAANKALRYMAPDGTLEKRIKELGVEKDPVLLRAFARLGMQLGEDSISGVAKPTTGTMGREKAMVNEMFGSLLDGLNDKEMAFTDERLTLADVANKCDPGGKIIPFVAEVLTKYNPILEDAPVLPTETDQESYVAIRENLPRGSWGRLNKGIKGYRKETCVFRKLPAIVDKRHENYTSDFAAIVADEHLTSQQELTQQMAEALLFANESMDDSEFKGFLPRLDDPTDKYLGEQIEVLPPQPGETSFFTALIVDWGKTYTHLLYPRNSKAGLTLESRETYVPDPEGDTYRAFVTEYCWHMGLAIKHPKHVARIANLSMKEESYAGETPAVDLTRAFIRALNRMDDPIGASRVIYVPRRIATFLRFQVADKNNFFLSLDDYAGRKILHFDGFPVKTVDALAKPCGLVTASS